MLGKKTFKIGGALASTMLLLTACGQSDTVNATNMELTQKYVASQDTKVSMFLPEETYVLNTELSNGGIGLMTVNSTPANLYTLYSAKTTDLNIVCQDVVSRFKQWTEKNPTYGVVPSKGYTDGGGGDVESCKNALTAGDSVVYMAAFQEPTILKAKVMAVIPPGKLPAQLDFVADAKGVKFEDTDVTKDDLSRFVDNKKYSVVVGDFT